MHDYQALCAEEIEQLEGDRTFHRCNIAKDFLELAEEYPF